MRKGVIRKLMIVFFAFVMMTVLSFGVSADENEPVVEQEATEITIVTQPADYAGPVGDFATFSVEAEGEGLSYQWQVNKTGSWVACSKNDGAKTATLTQEIKEARNGWKYQCVITDANGASLTSDEATLTVTYPFYIIEQPANYSGPVGEFATFTVEATGKDLTYQWQVWKSGAWSNCSKNDGAKTATLTQEIKESRNGWVYRCVIKDAFGEEIATDDCVLSISSPFSIVSQPESYSGPIGEIAEFYVETEGENLTYQWQVNKTGSWVNCSINDGAKTPVLTQEIKDARNGWKYHCIVTNAYGETITSDDAFLTVTHPITINSQPKSYYGPVGEFAEFTVGAEGEGLKYQWMVNKNGSSWVNCSINDGAKTATLRQEIKDSRNGWVYHCVITNSYGETAQTDDAVLTVAVDNIVRVTFVTSKGYFGEPGITSKTYEVEAGYFLLNKPEDFEQPYFESRSGNNLFRGWLDKDGNPVNNVNIDKDMTFYADWEEEILIVANANGGSFENGEDVMYCDANPGVQYLNDLFETPTKDGYVFAGWLVNGKITNRVNLAGLTEDLNVTAKWLEGVTVTYNGNGGTWYRYNGKTNEYVDTVVTTELKGRAYYVGFAEPEREGYRFTGWAINGQSAGRVYLNTDIVVDAVWERSFNVTYNPNGGGWYYYDPKLDRDILDQTPRMNSADVEGFWVGEAWPDREGYEFLGWSTDINATTAETDYPYDLTADTTFYAIWRKLGVVHFNANGGQWGYYEDPDEWETIRDEHRSTGEFFYVGYERPWREGYEFDCWVDGQENNVDDMEIQFGPDTDVTFYAKWRKIVTITYNGNGAQWSEWRYDPDENNYVETFVDERYEKVLGGEIFYPNMQPYYEGYEFVGWMDEDDNLIGPEGILLTDEDITLYAVWEKLIVVTYDGNGGMFSTHYVDEDRYEYYPVKTEYERANDRFNFVNWKLDRDDNAEFRGWTLVKDDYSTLINEPYDLTEDITVYAYWIIPANITYHTNVGGWYRWDEEEEEEKFVTSYTTETWRNGDFCLEYHVADVDYRLYEFKGFTLTEGSNVVDYRPGEYLELVTHDLDLYTVFEKYPMIKYYANGGAFHDSSDEHVDYDRAGHKRLVRCEQPNRDGYIFIGWEDADGNDASEAILELQSGDEYEFYAIWQKDGYTATFDANGGEFGNGQELQTCGVPYDQDFRFGCEWPSREGYEFVGWNTDRNATSGLYDWVSHIDNDITYYAIWEKATTITLDALDGEFGVWIEEVRDENDNIIEEAHMGSTQYYSTTQVSGSLCVVYDLPEPDDRIGYRFAGWSLDGDVVNTFIVGEEDVTLEAIWVRQYDVTFDANGGEFFDGETTRIWTFDEDDYVKTIWMEEPYKEGFAFAGWSIDDQYINYFTVDSEIVVKALWVPLG